MEVHGFYQMEFRGIADSFELTNYNPHQWAHTLNLEAEFDLLPDGWGPISLLQAYVRVEARFDCVWQSMCHIATGQRLWGDEANRAPGQFTNGKSSGFTGRLRNPGSPSEPVHGSGARLLPLVDIPPFAALLGAGGDATAAAVERLFDPINGTVFAVKHQQGSIAPQALPLGPWVPHDVKASGALRTITANGSPTPLPMRPSPANYFSPSPRLRELIGDFDDLDVNFSESELQWNRGASQQQTKELREAYIDMDLMDGQLFIRAGRQTTVWGKTELFRAQDQFNPQDIALATLSSLESSRIPLWSLRAIWSFWDVGPFQDVRLEFATNLDHYEPTDLGICGEPYTVWLACLKKAGVFAHGVLGTGLAGEERPPTPFEDSRGLEAGLRLEFRYGRFSFAITDFYGFPDIFTLDNFNIYERNVDPTTGRPRVAGATGLGTCTTGAEADCLTIANAAAFSSGNRQFFDVACGATLGIAAAAFEALDPAPFASDCLLDLFNTADSIELLGGLITIPVPGILSLAFGGSVFWNTTVAPLLVDALGGSAADVVPGILLHGGSLDDVGLATQYNPGTSSCGNALTDQQEALLGTGAFFNPDLAGSSIDICATRGIDLYHAEASVILEAFPQFDGTVGTRFIPGVGLLMLPGTRGPGEPGYDPLIDGCVMDLPNTPVAAGGDAGECDSLGANVLTDPRTGLPFRSEMTALSYNFMALLATISPALPDNENCDPSVATMMVDQEPLLNCTLVTALFGVAGAQRPEVSAGGNGRYGRRDFLWHGGSELRLIYKRRNVLGFSTDFAEDRTKTNWGVEFVWFEDEPYGNSHEVDGWSRHDTLALTVSMDRPTFVNFLNANRTIFFNAQLFVKWIDNYTDKALTPDGPFSALMTLTAFTGFWQDRLFTAMTMIHEIESNSSGLIVSMSYRMTENFSVSTGLTTFRGDPRSMRQARTSVVLSATSGNDYESRSRYNGLSAVSDREELFVNIRYTF
ncbi:MAG: hypothetical protein JRG83_20955 [Deltaproteobacteria bacterium]|nr:hypothetical protein [Deltaproteobacteria bacterium]